MPHNVFVTGIQRQRKFFLKIESTPVYFAKKSNSRVSQAKSYYTELQSLCKDLAHAEMLNLLAAKLEI